jgi:CheY-like chemotaxis protein
MSLDVLIVDDAGFIREILARQIKEMGHHVVGEAHTGEEAIEKARVFHPQLIFMDLVLPGMNGIEAVKQIRQILPSVHIAACSSIKEEYFQNKAFAAGCFVYLTKPFQSEDLHQVFKMISGQRSVAVGE